MGEAGYFFILKCLKVAFMMKEGVARHFFELKNWSVRPSLLPIGGWLTWNKALMANKYGERGAGCQERCLEVLFVSFMIYLRVHLKTACWGVSSPSATWAPGMDGAPVLRLGGGHFSQSELGVGVVCVALCRFHIMSLLWLNLASANLSRSLNRRYKNFIEVDVDRQISEGDLLSR